MSGHTPGPWSVCGEDRGVCQCRMVWSQTADGHVATAVPELEERHRGKYVACIHREWGDEYPGLVYGDIPAPSPLTDLERRMSERDAIDRKAEFVSRLALLLLACAGLATVAGALAWVMR